MDRKVLGVQGGSGGMLGCAGCFQLGPSPRARGVRSGVQGADDRCLELVLRVTVPPGAVATGQ